MKTPRPGQWPGFFMPEILAILLAYCYTLGMNKLAIAKRTQILPHAG